MKEMNEQGRNKLNLIASAFLLGAFFASTAATAANAPEVTIRNYFRAEIDLQTRTHVESMDAFEKFHYVREAYDVTNRDTLCSWSVFDLTSPPSIGLPDPGDR